MNKDKIASIIRRTPLYPLCKSIILRIQYSKKYSVGLYSTLFETTEVKCDLNDILSNAKIENVGHGPFFYSLDQTVLINNRNKIIDNMPIDYGKMVNRQIGNEDVEKIIRLYMNRINDSRICQDKPHDLKTALQSILFWNSLLWQTGHKLVGLGRLDKALDNFEVTDDAEDLITAFLETLHERYDFKSNTLRGDTGQIIILGGMEENGTYFCNQYTYLFIKCLKKLHLPDPKILLRCGSTMPKDLLEEAVECISTGIGSPLISNDDIVIPKLIDFGYDAKDAYNYGVSACWEPLSIGNSLEQNNLAHIEYGRCIYDTLIDSNFTRCKSFSDVLSLFKKILKEHCNGICDKLDMIQWEYDPLLTYLLGLDKDISTGSAKYNNYGILSVGMSSAVNSLLNIKTYVFEEHKYSLEQIKNVISSNYSDGTGVFSENRNGFGVDCEESINLTNQIISETENNFKEYRNKFGGKVKFGLSSPYYIDASRDVGATLDGRKYGEPFATHISRDKGEPITEIINFESKLHFTGISSNANVLDIMVQLPLIKDNINKFATYILGGLKEGLFQMQVNVLSYVQLVDAKLHPEKYPNLIVRVWGFSAYFNDLPDEYKDNLIRRAKEMEQIA